MKRILSIFLSVIMLFSCVPLTTYAADNHEHDYITETNKETGVQTTYCKDKNETTFSYDASTQYPESPHNYNNNMDKRYAYGVPGAVSYLVKFSDKCKTEAIYDTITVSNGSGETVGVYSGTELAGKTMLLEGTYFAIDMHSDHSATYYGFSIDTIVVNEENTSYVVPNILWETEHTYQNNLNQTYNVYVPGANEVNIEFSKIDFEKGYDGLAVYDANGKLIKEYSNRNITGSQLKLHIPSDRFSMVLYSDRSNTQNYYGFKIKSVTGTRTNASTVNPTGDYELLLPSADYPQTRHNYVANSNLNYGYKYPNAKSLKVKFSDKCKTEEKYDVITIYDENGNKLGTYSGTQLAGKTIDIPTGAFNISFTSDHSKNYYGFSIDSIVATMSSNPETVGSKYSRAYDTPIIPHTSHNYANNADETYYYTDATASSLDLQFYTKCLTEANYDFITVYDKNGKQLARYSGKQAANKFLHINGNSFSIKFTSDGSKTYYGYSLFYVSPNYYSAHEGSNVYAYPETSHKYENYAKQTYKYVSPYADAKALDLRFSSQTLTESNYDFITLYDGNGKLVGKYSGSQLAGKTIRVDGNNFKIDFTTDRSASYYGFSFDAITSVFDTDYYKQIELRHNYVQTHTIKENGITHKLYVCTNCGDIQKDVNLDTESLIIALDKSEFAFDGQEHKPLPVFENGELELIKGVDYTLTYDKDCTTVGEHKVVVNFINKYSGTRELVYVIYPNNIPEITVENTGFGFNVNFTENAAYSVVYADNENFENAKTVGVAASDKAIISDVEVGKTYYVKAASCAAQNGKLYYSDYCNTQTVYIDGVMGEVSNLTLSKVYVTDMPWAVKATWDAVPGADEYEVFIRCWDYDVVQEDRQYNSLDTAFRYFRQNRPLFDDYPDYGTSEPSVNPCYNKELYVYPANFCTIDRIENDKRFLNAHKGIVRPFYTDEQIMEEVEKGDFLNYAYPEKVDEPTLSSDYGYFTHDNYYYRFYKPYDPADFYSLEKGGKIIYFSALEKAIAISEEAIPAYGIKYITTDTEFTTYANLADYFRYTISVRAIRKNDVNNKGSWNTQLIKLEQKHYRSYTDPEIFTQSEKDYIVSELLKAKSYVKKIWNLNVDFNFFDMTEEVKEDLYVRNLARYYEIDSWLFFPAVPALNHNPNTNYSEWVSIVNKNKEIALWDVYGDFWSYFQQHVYYDKDNEYDIFYAWVEDEGGIYLVLVCDSHRVVYRSAGGTFRNALGLPNCGKYYCESCEQIRFANSRI